LTAIATAGAPRTTNCSPDNMIFPGALDEMVDREVDGEDELTS
jgi:hypothetical protein